MLVDGTGAAERLLASLGMTRPWKPRNALHG